MLNEADAEFVAGAELLLAVAAVGGVVASGFGLDEYTLKLLQPAATFGGIVVSVWLAASQPSRTRVAGEAIVALAATRASYDAIKLVAERMEPRLDPKVQQAEGRTLRGVRSRATVEALGEIKLSELPAEFIPHFNRVRSGLLALTAAMDKDPWPTAGEPLSQLQLRRFQRYAVSFEWALEGYEAMRIGVEDRVGVHLPEYGWRIPTSEALRARDAERFPGIAPRPLPKPRGKSSPAQKKPSSRRAASRA